MKIRSGFAENLNKLIKNPFFAALCLVLSAVLTALTLIFEILSPLVFVSLVPLVLILMGRCENKNGKSKNSVSSYGVAFLWSFSFYIIIYHWFWYLWPMEFLGVERPMALLITLFCWIGLSLLQALGTALVGPFFCVAYKKGGLNAAAIIFASAWTLLEYAQSLTWAGVPWARLALSQTAFPAAIQSASLLGSLFIGFIIAAVNGLLASALASLLSGEKGGRIKSACFASLALATVLLNVGGGLVFISLNDETKGEEIKVTVVQGNISSNDKWADNSNYNSMNVYEKLTREANEKQHADIVVWPETMLTNSVKQSSMYSERISELAKETGSVIFVGAFDESPNGDTVDVYNALIAFFPDGSVEDGSYKKQHLVPFGEYMPMRGLLEKVLPFMSELNILGDDLAPGTESEILTTEYGKIGRLICFDSIYPSLARRSTADGAELILLSTNDSWYRDSASAYQHNSHAILRALENGRYIARAASTGISAVISSEGEVTALIAPLESGYITSSVYLKDSRTLYSYVGDIIVLPCAAVIAAYVLVRIFGNIRKKENKSAKKQ